MASLPLEFEPDYRAKILRIAFTEETRLEDKKDVLAWRSQWTQELKSWHSPYKAVIDVSNLKIADNEEVTLALERMHKFLKGFFLRNVAAFGAGGNITALPFETFATQEEAAQYLKIRTAAPRVAGDFRSSIQLENHFRQHVVELSFLNEQVIDKVEQVRILKDKLTNNLMQWHSKWSLIVDCTLLKMEPEVFDEFDKMVRFFNGFFLKKIVGYSPAEKDALYPFQVFRARHKAAALLESEGLTSGESADCASRK